MRVLVTNAFYHNALAIVRSLGKRGLEVHASTNTAGRLTRLKALAFASKYCSGRHFYQDPRISAEGFVDSLEVILQRRRFDVLLPVGVDTVVAASMQRDRLERHCCIPLASSQAIGTAHDKSLLLNIARDVGILIPETQVLHSVDDATRAAVDIGFPMVIKPRKGAGARGVHFLNSIDDFQAVYSRFYGAQRAGKDDDIHDLSRPLLQEMIPGRIHDVCLIAQHGRVLISLTQERLRMYPTAGGSGIVNRTTDVGELKSLAEELVRALSWHGVAQIEFKQDLRDGKFKLMEFNPKFWGTLALSISAGLDFPYLACQLALGQEISKADIKYRSGVVYRWPFPHEVMAIVDAPLKLKALKALFTRYGDETHTDFLWSDPSPFLLQLAVTPLKVLQSWKGSARRKRVPFAGKWKHRR